MKKIKCFDLINFDIGVTVYSACCGEGTGGDKTGSDGSSGVTEVCYFGKPGKGSGTTTFPQVLTSVIKKTLDWGFFIIDYLG